MDQVIATLKDLGLTKSEAQVYVAGLGYGSVSAAQIAKETGMKRPTVYHALETLGQKGLVSKRGTTGKVVFTMTDPEGVKRLHEQRMREMEQKQSVLADLIPLLQLRQQEGSPTEVEVVQHQGIEGIKLVVEEALYCKSRQWDLISPKKNFFSEFSKEYAQYFLSTRTSREIRTRSLWELTEDGKKRTPGGHPLSASLIKERNPRFLPAFMRGNFQSVILLFDDKVAIISSYKTLSAVLISSSEISQTFRTMFEGLWALSESPTT